MGGSGKETKIFSASRQHIVGYPFFRRERKK
jgi:hypothetical protein